MLCYAMLCYVNNNRALDVIETLYDRVVCGGIVYVDDYMGFNGAREAINDFRTHRRCRYYRSLTLTLISEPYFEPNSN